MKKKIRIDWPNHLVAFLSSLFGIFIAFQLQDLQDWRRQRNQAIQTVLMLKHELSDNKKLLQRQIETISSWIENTEFVLERSAHPGVQGNELQATSKEIEAIKKRNADYPGRLQNVKLLRSINDTLNVYHADTWIAYDFVIEPLATDTWQAAKSSGTLADVDPEKLALISKAYAWLEKDIGKEEFSESEMLFYNQLPGGSIGSSLEIYKHILHAYEIKLAQLNAILPLIEESD